MAGYEVVGATEVTERCTLAGTNCNNKALRQTSHAHPAQCSHGGNVALKGEDPPRKACSAYAHHRTTYGELPSCCCDK
jgi:hypothetical protein